MLNFFWFFAPKHVTKNIKNYGLRVGEHFASKFFFKIQNLEKQDYFERALFLTTVLGIINSDGFLKLTQKDLIPISFIVCICVGL